jgi:ketosteroid isomerase-like protein
MNRTAAEAAVALVTDYYAAFNRGDREAMLALLADDVAHDLNQGERETGKAASPSSWRAWMPATASA